MRTKRLLIITATALLALFAFVSSAATEPKGIFKKYNDCPTTAPGDAICTERPGRALEHRQLRRNQRLRLLRSDRAGILQSDLRKRNDRGDGNDRTGRERNQPGDPQPDEHDRRKRHGDHAAGAGAPEKPAARRRLLHRFGKKPDPAAPDRRYDRPATAEQTDQRQLGTPESEVEKGFESVVIRENTLVDNSFSAPASEGCGGFFSFLIGPIVNSKIGLPSAAGKNTAILSGTLNTAEEEAVVESEKF
jgi:hypothetical protein